MNLTSTLNFVSRPIQIPYWIFSIDAFCFLATVLTSLCIAEIFDPLCYGHALATNPEEAEAIAVIRGLEAAQRCGLSRVLLLTNCKRLVRAFRDRSDDLTWGTLTLAPDLRALSDCFVDFRFEHIDRSCNFEAHCLAGGASSPHFVCFEPIEATNHLTGGKIGDRLVAEAETNLAINVLPGMSESYEVQGRGELQLGILIENMRREGFELSVSPPKVMYKIENGAKLEPLEEVTIEVNEEHVGVVMEVLSHRKAEVVDMGPVPGNVGRTRMSLTCPSRGLVGYRSVFSSDTRGTGFMHRAFLNYENFRGPLGNVRKGVLVSCGNGMITAHALMSLEARGTLFVSPGTETYDGMIVGEHSRDTDLDINPVRMKELSNMRSANKDENVKLSPPRLMTLEEAIGYVASDELIEVTPKFIRLRKKYMDASKRKTMAKRPKE
ncbi:hypothetical protein GIB67_022056 [Kingdonia uniflora]|uniref:Elongation factor EFG domain-containing protein n=1 Tax=Kingdonia uniflora TaxID=39325 RepID=A0A7J7MU64_9MAGN|nr:hypothetical protein GIB67_022056 [Kingdonia uniflora]